jgi:hypothetical protein
MPTLTIHIKTTEGGLIKEPSILLDYSQRSDFGPMKRMLNHRKVDQQDLAYRTCSQDEIKECSHPHRIGFLVYRNWDLLIADERKFTQDPEWFAKLEALKKKYPQFNQEKEGEDDH